MVATFSNKGKGKGSGGSATGTEIKSFNVSPTAVEIGRTVIPLFFSWSLGGEVPTSISIDNGVGSISPSSPPFKTFTTNLDPETSYLLYTLSVTKGSKTVTATAGLTFNNTFRYGLFEDTDTIDNDFLLSLQYYIQPHRNRTYYQNGLGKKIIFAHSQAYGSVTSVKIGGFNSLSLFEKTSFTFTNQYGHVEDYWLYKSINTFNGDNMLIEIE